MYQFVFGFINITDLSIDVEWQVCTTLLVSQLSAFASDLIFIYALIIGLLLTSKSQNMITILEFPNGKNVNWEVQQMWMITCISWENRHSLQVYQSQNVGPCKTLPEINLLQVQFPSQNNTRARKMHSPQSGCYDHVTSEIWLVCQTV